MKKFNLAFYPQDLIFISKLTNFAEENFKENHSGYLLGPGALPHVTGCQFLASNNDHAQLIAEFCCQFLPREITLKADMFYFRPKKDAAQNVYNAGILVTKTEQIVLLQKMIHDRISEQGGTPITKPGDDYWPHFTLAYTSKTNFNHPSLEGWAFRECSCILVLGDTDEQGQLTKIIWTPTGFAPGASLAPRIEIP